MKISVNNTALYYQSIGQGEPLVFLNGIMMTVASWAHQVTYFSKHYRCILHDFRDQLMSAPAQKPYTMEQHAHDLAGLLDILGEEQCHVVGTSYGGEVALLFAHLYPERVKSLVVIASVPYAEPLLKLQIGNWKKAALLAPHLLYEQLAVFSFSNAYLIKHPNFIQMAKDRLKTYPPKFFQSFARLCDAFLQLDIRDKLPQIQCPTLLLAAEKDILNTMEDNEFMARHIPNSKLSVIPNAGHAVVSEAPRAINLKLEEFFNQLG